MKNSIDSIALYIKGYEFGPGVPKIILTLAKPISAVSTESLIVVTAGENRQVSQVYISDNEGHLIGRGESVYLTIEMPVTFDQKQMKNVSSPFFFNGANYHHEWVRDYKVSIKGLLVTMGHEIVTLEIEDYNAITNLLSPDVAPFQYHSEYSGTYTNPLTKQDEALRLQCVAYEPETAKTAEKLPLLIWLHGQGEGGADVDITLLGNKVVALAQPKIQAHFEGEGGTGAYILALQCPTYWMDEGDGKNGVGAGVSRYTDIVMDAIQDFVSRNPKIDKNRLYLTGCSNGGYMTLNLAIHNPDYFAALIPQAAAYAYHCYQRQSDGTYALSTDNGTFIQTDEVYFDEAKLNAIKDTPIWFIHAADDTIVAPENYSLPIYKSLLDGGATNAWFSYYESVEGSDIKGMTYPGHWSWLYFFNDEVFGVQSMADIKKATDLSGFSPNNADKGGRSQAKVNGICYHNLFDWLNVQKKPF